MANVTRAHAVLKNKHNDSFRNFKDMLQDFKRKVAYAGILHDYKEHQYYESKSEKARRKKKEFTKKHQMSMLEEKILSGERVKAPSGVIKKIMSNKNKKTR